MNLPAGMTSEKLREIANWLDTYDLLAEKYLDLLEQAGVTGTYKALVACRGKEVQDDLRNWADDIDWAET